MEDFSKLKRLMGELLDPERGCRWLIQQSFATLAPYTIEEAFELVEAIEQGEAAAIQDELADQLYHLLLYAELGSQQGWFDFSTIATAALQKQQKRRHLHELTVFSSAEEAHADWRERKRQQRHANPQLSVLDGIPVAMPALARSQKIQDRVADEGFDWSEVQQVLAKLQEELAELQVEIQQHNTAAMHDELGDVLFTLVNVARHLRLDAEQALRQANRKFEKRFRYVEAQLQQQHTTMREQTFDALLRLWEVAKKAK